MWSFIFLFAVDSNKLLSNESSVQIWDAMERMWRHDKLEPIVAAIQLSEWQMLDFFVICMHKAKQMFATVTCTISLTGMHN